MSRTKEEINMIIGPKFVCPECGQNQTRMITQVPAGSHTLKVACVTRGCDYVHTVAVEVVGS